MPFLNPELAKVLILLLSCHSNIFKENMIQQRNFRLHKPVEYRDNGETDYKMNYVTPFVESVFHLLDRFQIYRGLPFDCFNSSDVSILRGQISYAKFVEIGGSEVGAVEVKSFLTSPVDIDNAIIRLGKITKRMLHVRVLKAKPAREFFTFGVTAYGSVVEYYIHRYHSPAVASSSPSSPTPLPVYTFELIERRSLPTLPTTFTHMYLSLKYLIHYKKLMEDSLAEDSDIDNRT